MPGRVLTLLLILLSAARAASAPGPQSAAWLLRVATKGLLISDGKNVWLKPL